MVIKCPKIFKGRKGFNTLKSQGFSRSMRNIVGKPIFSSSKKQICEIANKNKGKVKILEFEDNKFTLLGKNSLSPKFELKQ